MEHLPPARLTIDGFRAKEHDFIRAEGGRSYRPLLFNNVEQLPHL